VNGKVYSRLELIGRGGSSKVYKVMDENGRVYALKKVNLKGADDLSIEGYLNEINLLKKLQGNDRIIRLLDSEIGYVGGYILMVSEKKESSLFVRIF